MRCRRLFFLVWVLWRSWGGQWVICALSEIMIIIPISLSILFIRKVGKGSRSM